MFHSYAEPNSIACAMCSRGFKSSWHLLSHVQSEHRLKLLHQTSTSPSIGDQPNLDTQKRKKDASSVDLSNSRSSPFKRRSQNYSSDEETPSVDSKKSFLVVTPEVSLASKSLLVPISSSMDVQKHFLERKLARSSTSPENKSAFSRFHPNKEHIPVSEILPYNSRVSYPTSHYERGNFPTAVPVLRDISPVPTPSQDVCSRRLRQLAGQRFTDKGLFLPGSSEQRSVETSAFPRAYGLTGTFPMPSPTVPDLFQLNECLLCKKQFKFPNALVGHYYEAHPCDIPLLLHRFSQETSFRFNPLAGQHFSMNLPFSTNQHPNRARESGYPTSLENRKEESVSIFEDEDLSLGERRKNDFTRSTSNHHFGATESTLIDDVFKQSVIRGRQEYSDAYRITNSERKRNVDFRGRELFCEESKELKERISNGTNHVSPSSSLRYKKQKLDTTAGENSTLFKSSRIYKNNTNTDQIQTNFLQSKDAQLQVQDENDLNVDVKPDLFTMTVTVPSESIPMDSHQNRTNREFESPASTSSGTSTTAPPPSRKRNDTCEFCGKVANLLIEITHCLMRFLIEPISKITFELLGVQKLQQPDCSQAITYWRETLPMPPLPLRLCPIEQDHSTLEDSWNSAWQWQSVIWSLLVEKVFHIFLWIPRKRR